MNQGAILNAYPDSLGRNLAETVEFLSLPELKDVFQGFYILPSVFNTDIDRGFSVISYELCENLARPEDLRALKDMNYDLMFDIILNHLSVLSPQFQDIIKNGDRSEYKDFFINWNEFWEGNGEMGEDGCIVPYADKFDGMDRRRLTLPVLMVRFPDGREVPYWNTFFKKITYRPVDEMDLIEITNGQYDTAKKLAERINSEIKNGKTPKTMDWNGFERFRAAAGDFLESRRRYLGQMDVNVKSPLVWEWYNAVMDHFTELGADILRLDAFTGLYKEPGKKSSLNTPETLELLQKIKGMAEERGLDVLPEVHASYESGAIHRLWDIDCTSYDYFLPVLLIDAMDKQDSQWICRWAQEQISRGIRTVNMLGCHDGIPIRDPRGTLPDERVDDTQRIMVENGGREKYVHGEGTEVYQVDVTYFSTLGCDERKLLLARAVQLFMPGRPQIWYLDLLAGANDLEIFELDPTADNREINRHNFTLEECRERIKLPVVAKQLELLRFRNTHPAFSLDSEITVCMPDTHSLNITWKHGEHSASLMADFEKLSYEISSSPCV